MLILRFRKTVPDEMLREVKTTAKCQRPQMAHNKSRPVDLLEILEFVSVFSLWLKWMFFWKNIKE